MNTRLQSASVLMAAFVMACGSQLHAQTRSTGTGGSSLFGGGASSFGGGLGSSAAGGLGGGGFGGGGLGQGGQGGFGAQSGLGASIAGPDQGFVGRDAGEVSNFFDFLSPQFGQGGGGGGGSRASMQRGRDANSTQDVRPPILVKLRLGFTPPTRSPLHTGPATTSRVNEILARRGIADARVIIQEGVAVITGSVDSESDRLLIEQLVLLEPGVSSVENNATVNGQLPAPTGSGDRS